MYLWNADVWRLVGNYTLATDSDALPSVTAGFAFQDTFSDRISPYVTAAKHYHVDEFTFEPYVGLVDRPNESHVHGLSGLRISRGNVFVGFQHTGHELNAYFGANVRQAVGSIWFGEGQSYGLTLGYRF